MQTYLFALFVAIVALAAFWPHVALLLALLLFACMFLWPDDSTPA